MTIEGLFDSLAKVQLEFERQLFDVVLIQEQGRKGLYLILVPERLSTVQLTDNQNTAERLCFLLGREQKDLAGTRIFKAKWLQVTITFFNFYSLILDLLIL